MDRTAFINEVKEYARRKAVTLNDMFSDYDPKGLGTITLHQFRRILSQLNVWVNEARLNNLIQSYVDEGLFRYKEFFDTSNTSSSKPTLTENELMEFALSFSTQGIPALDWFQQFDPYHIGRISIQNFIRAVLCRKELAQKVISAYKFPGKDEIDYITLSRDIAKNNSQRNSGQLSSENLHLSQSLKSVQLPPFFPSLCECIRSSGLDPKVQFLAHDRYHHQRIPPQLFLQELPPLGIRLSPNQTTEILKAFSVGNEIDYIAFCNEVSKYLAENEPAQAKPSELVDVNSVLNTIANDLRYRPTTLIENMQYFDQNQTGIIPIFRFERAFTTANYSVTKRELTALVNEFKVDNNNVNYRKFAERVQPAAPVASIDNIMQRLKSFLQSRYIQLEPVLLRLDRDNSGCSTIEDLFFALRSISFDITEREQQRLRSELGQHPINIKDFCSKIDPQIEPRQRLSRSLGSRQVGNDSTNSNATPSVFAKTPYAPKPQREPPQQEVTEAISRVIGLANKCNVDLYQQFRQIDNLRQGTLLTTRFRAILSSIGTHPSDIQRLIQTYSNDDYHETVKYVDFYNDLREIQRNSQPINTGLTISDESKAIMVSIKAEMETNSMSVDNFFNRYDTTNTYRVPKSRVAGILYSIGLKNLTQNQIQHFIDDFGDQRLNEMFNYKKLIDMLDEMTISTQELQAIKLNTSDSIKNKEIASLINSIRERLYSRRRRPMNIFSGCDRNGISSREFRSRINESGIVLTEADMQKLLRTYKCNYNGDVDWFTFCQNVDSSKTVQLE